MLHRSPNFGCLVMGGDFKIWRNSEGWCGQFSFRVHVGRSHRCTERMPVGIQTVPFAWIFTWKKEDFSNCKRKECAFLFLIFCPIDKTTHCYGSTWSLLPDHRYVNSCHVVLSRVKVLCNTDFSHRDGKQKHSERVIVGYDMQGYVCVCSSYLTPGITGSSF